MKKKPFYNDKNTKCGSLIDEYHIVNVLCMLQTELQQKELI